MTLSMPAAESGWVPTLNNQGWMLTALDVYTQAFVEFAGRCTLPVVDIGAAYGVTALPALEAGAQVIAVDMDARHLQILTDRAPAEMRSRLTTQCAEFPEGVDFAAESIGAVMASRVLHFLVPPRFQAGLEKIYRWLSPGGKLFLTAETPYLANWPHFRPVYEARKREGNLWPGLVEDTSKFITERGSSLPPTILFLDPDVVQREAERAGFRVERCAFLARPEYPPDLRLDGRESVGLIAVKP